MAFDIVERGSRRYADVARDTRRSEGTTTRMIQSIDRALRILTVLQGARRMSLGEIAARLELPPSTVHGIIRTLLAHGMVQQERDSGRYRLGPATLRLGNVYLDTLELRSRVAVGAEDPPPPTRCAVRAGGLLFDQGG